MGITNKEYEEIMNRIGNSVRHTYNRGYEDGMKDARGVITDRLEENLALAIERVFEERIQCGGDNGHHLE